MGPIQAGLAPVRACGRHAIAGAPVTLFTGALFTGAIANGCVGLHRLLGMALGIAAGIVPMMHARPSAWRRWKHAREGQLDSPASWIDPEPVGWTSLELEASFRSGSCLIGEVEWPS
jgi:hypothetical protein